MKYFLMILWMVFVVGCSQQESAAVAKAPDQPVTVAPVEKQTTPFDGLYVFDAETYKKDQEQQADSMFKDMKAEDVDKMLRIFKPFQIELEGKTATASFAHDVIKGSIQKISQSNQGAHLSMTPIDSDKKDQSVTLVIEGEQLILDPGKKLSDRMFFKKVM